jgi:small subunit ribosomal protein S13
VARISGVDLPRNKRIIIALTYVFGVGPKLAEDICKETRLDISTRVKDLSEDEVLRLREAVNSRVVEGDLRRRVGMDIRRLTEIGCYRGVRHRRKLPVRGQRTHTNARTKRGKKVAVAGKKKVTR